MGESAQHELILDIADEEEHLRSEVEEDHHEEAGQDPTVEVVCVEQEVNDAAGADEIQILPDGISLDPAGSAPAKAEGRSTDSNARAGEKQNASSAFGLRVSGQDLRSAKARQQLDVRRRGGDPSKRRALNRYQHGRKFVSPGQVRASSALTNAGSMDHGLSGGPRDQGSKKVLLARVKKQLHAQSDLTTETADSKCDLRQVSKASIQLGGAQQPSSDYAQKVIFQNPSELSLRQYGRSTRMSIESAQEVR